MKRTYLITHAVWILFAGAVAVESWRLGFGTFVSPGPGFVPFLTALLLGGLAVVAFFQTALAGGKTESDKGFRGTDVLRILVAMAVLFVDVLLWEVIGFLPATFLLLVFLFRCVEPLGWRRVLTASVLTLAFTYVLFVTLLGARLPHGRIWKYFLS
jgi:hypothetical protein